MTLPMQVTNQSDASRRDVLAVVAGTLLFFGLSAAFELSEKVLALTRPWERYQLDELPGVLLFLAAALSWFGWRRVRELADSEEHVIPGHDPAVMVRYPAPQKKLAGIVARLD